MPMLSTKEKDQRDAFIQKEKNKIGTYFDYRDKKLGNSNQMNGILQKGIICKEAKFAAANNISKQDLSKSKVSAPRPVNNDEDDELDIDFGGKPQQSLKFNFMDKLKSKNSLNNENSKP